MKNKLYPVLSDYNEGEEFKTAGQKAYEIISRKILKGDLAPGIQLSRRKMADLTGVSVIPVNEALKQLEEDGLVESKPQWGAFVTVPTDKKIVEMYILRKAIECQVARILSEKMTLEQEDELRSLAQSLDSFKFAKETQNKINKLHYKLHSRMTELTGYSSLIKTHRKTNLFYLLCKAVAHTRIHEELSGPMYWHELLIDEIKSGDKDRAEKAMRDHIDASFQVILRDVNLV